MTALDMEALDEAAKLAPLYLSDCDDELQIWRESALLDVRRDESGEIVGYRTPGCYKATDLVAEWDLDGWDEDEGDTTDDKTRRKAAEAFVMAINSLPAMLRSGEDLGAMAEDLTDTMRLAVNVAASGGPQAGMNVIVDKVRSVPEMAEGLDFSMPGGDRPQLTVTQLETLEAILGGILGDYPIGRDAAAHVMADFAQVIHGWVDGSYVPSGEAGTAGAGRG